MSNGNYNFTDLEVYCNLIYLGSEPYTKKDGSKTTLYLFSDGKHTYKQTLPTAPALEPNSNCLCLLEIYRFKRNDSAWTRDFKIRSIQAIKK